MIHSARMSGLLIFVGIGIIFATVIKAVARRNARKPRDDDK